MWKWSTKPKNSVAFHEQSGSEIFLIESADSLLKQFHDSLYELKQLISVTAADYHYFYLNLIKAAAVFMQILPSLLYPSYNKQYGLLTLALDRAIGALKYRRAYMLPTGADTETCYKEQDVWTYALFAVALLKDSNQVINYFDITLLDKQQRSVKKQSLTQPFTALQAYYYQFKATAFDPLAEPRCDNMALIKALLPERGLIWLQSHVELFKTWEGCLFACPSTGNVLADIINQVETVINKTNTINTIATSHPPAIEVHKKETEVITKPLSKTEAILPTESVTPLSGAQLTLAERFILWLKHEITANTLGINQHDGVLHHVAEGILIVMPAAYERFQGYEGNTVTVITKRDKHRFLKELLATEGSMITKSYQTLPRYYWGDWHARQLIEGILITPAMLFHPDKLPPLNPHLHLDPDLDSP